MPSNAPPLKPKVREGEIGGMCMCVVLAGHKFCGYLWRQPEAWRLTKQLALSIRKLQAIILDHLPSVELGTVTVCAITQSCDVQMSSNT